MMNKMKRKQIILTFAVFVFLLIPINNCFAQGPSSAALSVNLTQQTPFPAEPGKDLDLKLIISNWGYKSATNVNITLELKSPFELKSGETSTKIYNSIWSGKSLEVEYNLRVDSNAVSGNYKLNVNLIYYSDSVRYEKTEEIEIRVVGKPDIILINTTGIENAKPKSNFDLCFNYKNIGTGPAKNTKISFSTTQTVFAPKISNLYIGEIKAGEVKETCLNFYINTSTPSEYSLPITFSYENELSESQTPQTYYVSIPVIEENEPFVYLDSQTKFGQNSLGSLTIGIANRGLSRIKYLTVNLEKSDCFELLDTNTRYIGNIESDDYDTVDFDIINNCEPGMHSFVVKINYKDEYGNSYELEKTLSMKVYSKTELALLSPPNTTFYWVILIVLIFLGYYLFIRKKIHKKFLGKK